MEDRSSNGGKGGAIPMRLHHAACVCRDLAQTRNFYEEILGWPMVAAWRECDKVFGEDERAGFETTQRRIGAIWGIEG